MPDGEGPEDGRPIEDGKPGTLPGVGKDRAAAAVGETMPAAVAPPAAARAPKPSAPPPVSSLAGGDTMPGTVAPAIPATPFRAGAFAETAAPATPAAFGETLPGGGAGKAGETAAGTGAPKIRAPVGAQIADSETLDAAHGGTLQGPYKVADLPTLPRVDDTTYAIGVEIARGGMGKILAARDRRLRREVVIKVMRRESGRIDPRFEREALITARLQHPSIVRVYDAGVLGDGRAFYAMERVRGRSLEVVLEGAKTLRDRLALVPHAIAVCDALAYAHNEGIVHRDLKPSNVLLGPFGETVVIDWGLAKDLRATGESGDALPRAPSEADSGSDSDSGGGARGSGGRDAGDSSLTQHGAVMGTPSFMAPEQARGELADDRTDVYALGALLYTMLTGTPPVTGSSSDEVIDAVAAGRRKPIVEVVPELPPELVSIVEHAMALERAERPSAKILAEDLRSFAAGKLVPSHAYTTWQLVRRWIARHRVSVGIAASAVVLLAVLGVVAFQNIRRERDKAQNERDNLIIGQAIEAKDKDPSTSAAWLKKLSDRALGWQKTTKLVAQLPKLGLAHQLTGHAQDVEFVTSSRDGKHAATASDDHTVRWWDLEAGTSVVFAGHRGPIESMTISTDGTYLATAGTDSLAILWTVANAGSRVLHGHTNTVRGVAFSPDNSKLASTGEEGSLFIWDVASATGEKLVDYTHSLRAVTWIDNTTVLIGAFDGAIGKVDLATKQTVWMRDHNLKAELRDIAVTPDRKYWLASDEAGGVVLWSSEGKKLKELVKHEDVAREVIITTDGKYVVSAGGNFDVHVHSIPDGTFHALKGNEAGIKDVDVSGDLVVAAGIDGVVRVWKLDGTLLHEWRGHSASVKGAVFVGRRIVSGAEDKMVRVWNLDAPPPPPSGIALRAWLDQQTNLEIPDPAEI